MIISIYRDVCVHIFNENWHLSLQKGCLARNFELIPMKQTPETYIQSDL